METVESLAIEDVSVKHDRDRMNELAMQFYHKLSGEEISNEEGDWFRKITGLFTEKEVEEAMY